MSVKKKNHFVIVEFQIQGVIAYSGSTHSWKLWLSTVDKGHHIDRWPSCAWLCKQVSPESNSVHTLYTPQTSFGLDYKPRSHVCMHAQRSHTQVKDSVIHVRVWWIMETLNHAACIIGLVVWLSHLAFSGENDPNFPWEKSQWIIQL